MTSPEPAFEPARASTSGSSDGVPWHTTLVRGSLRRISEAPSLDAAAAQAATEQVVLLHSIRRILLWTLVFVPLILAAAGVLVLLSTL